MRSETKFLGIVKNGAGLLSSFRLPPDERGAVAAHIEAGKSLYAWAMLYPYDEIRIEPLSRRDAKGWEVAR